MKSTIKITNPELFYASNVEVDTAMLSCVSEGECSGHIAIYFNDEELQCDGQHGANDFEDEFGFVIINK
jgi:uncharacterized Zn-finger protein